MENVSIYNRPLLQEQTTELQKSFHLSLFEGIGYIF